MSSRSNYERATQETAESLHKVAESLASRRLTKLSLPELDAVVEIVSKIIPAGNVPGMILSGLTRISGNKVQPQKARQDINILFKEVSLFFEQAKYGAVFAGPAAVIWGYQNLLRMAGKDPESGFPEGVWQFYVDYALRDDTARHANETNGFDLLLSGNNIHLNDVDRLTAWIMAAVTCLHNFNSLLASEWHERTSIWVLQELGKINGLHEKWIKIKPYGRHEEGAEYDYSTYRRLKFDQFLTSTLRELPQSVKKVFEEEVQKKIDGSLEDFQKQLSILAYLEPGLFGETRTPIELEDAQIGVIHNGNYFLVPVCEPGTSDPLDVRMARAQAAYILSARPRRPAHLKQLARIRRSELAIIRGKLSSDIQHELNKLRFAPLLINFKQQTSADFLSEIRMGERGVGDHALTIFDTGSTFVFDQSHIFFDGSWGAALAEIMTNEALSWAVYLNMLSPPPEIPSLPYSDLDFDLTPADEDLIHRAQQVSYEASAENNKVDVEACLSLRRYVNQRNELLKLTINDLLMLYRAIHAETYRPSRKLLDELETLGEEHTETLQLIKQVMAVSAKSNPSILIPVDASLRVPRDRIYPLNIEVPITELDLLNIHAQALKSLTEYEAASNHDEKQYVRFAELQRQYLATLGGFGTILTKAKEIAVQGESASVGAIKLLAHLPTPLKHLLDKIPARYEKLNNIIKGTEVLSNLGAVAESSSLTRFMTAKDDNEQKQLTWGVMTDAKGVMVITLRDFRPHVAALNQIDRQDLANLIAQDYLDSYAQGLNQYLHEVTRIAVAHPRDSNNKNRKIEAL